MSDDTTEPYREDYESLTDEDRSAQYARLQEDLHAHPGWIARQQWTAVHRSFSIWRQNTQQLLTLLALTESDENLKRDLVQNVRKPTGRESFLAALDMTLHNVTTSIGSLVDHTRPLIDRYPETEFAEEFDTRNSAVRDAPTSAFLRTFRNVLLHATHAPYVIRSNVGTEVSVSIVIDGPALMAQDPSRWTGAAKRFVVDNPDGIDLVRVAVEFTQALTVLYKWVFEQEEGLHGADREAMNDLVKRINLTMSAGAQDGRHIEEFWQHVANNLKAEREGRPQVNWQDVKPKDQTRAEAPTGPPAAVPAARQRRAVDAADGPGTGARKHREPGRAADALGLRR